MIKYATVYQCNQDSEYASCPKYAKMTKLLIMTGFSKCLRYTVFWICQNMP